MSTRIVYRVEQAEEGYGPYLKGDESHTEVIGLHSAHARSSKHPGPWWSEEGLSYHLTDDHQFGFDSRDKLDEWFKGFKRKLKAANFVVRIYEAPEDSTFTSDSGKQTIFLKDRSRLVDTQSVIRYRS